MNGMRSLPGWVVPVGLGALVIGLVSVALIRGPVQLDPDTPEGTVQDYLVALNERRWADALEVLHPQWRGECQADDLSGFAIADFSAELGTADTGAGFGEAVIVEERFGVIGEGSASGVEQGEEEDLPGGTTFVEVTIHHQGEGGLGSTWDEYTMFELLDDDDFWWIVGDPWPYFTWECRGR